MSHARDIQTTGTTDTSETGTTHILFCPQTRILLSCSLEELQLRFQAVQELKDMHSSDDLRMVSWLPASPTLLMHFRSHYGTPRFLLHTFSRDGTHAGPEALAYNTFSPSRCLILQHDRDGRAIQVADVSSGMLCWDVAPSDPRWPKLHGMDMAQAQRSSYLAPTGGKNCVPQVDAHRTWAGLLHRI